MITEKLVSDPYNLQRFVNAQNPMYEQVCSELRNGQKESHWIWFIFPQLRGLGHSPMALAFGISSREEAEAYLQHPILGPRLRECTGLVNHLEGRSINAILGYPDNLKFRSSMTLFASVSPDDPIFKDALQKYFGGELDARNCPSVGGSMRLGLQVRLFLAVIIIAILLIGFRVYHYRSGSNLNVTPDAQREIERAKRR